MSDHRTFGRSLMAGSCLLLAMLYVVLSDARGAGPAGAESGRALAYHPKRETLPRFKIIWEAPEWGGKSGYLSEGPPPALRFSDEAAGSRRPLMPALPEFAFVSPEYFPYVIESPLPEDANADASQFSQMVVDLEPYTIVSGAIDTKASEASAHIETISSEEPTKAVLRPEEVLIFFESDGRRSDTTTVIPFSPANPSERTIQSSAEYIRE